MDDLLTAIEIQRTFSEYKAQDTEERETHKHKWRWTHGTIMYPESRCPYCNVIMKSNRIYVLGASKILLQYYFQDGHIVQEKVEHPHQDSTHVCFGNTSDLVSALFLGLNPTSPLNGKFKSIGYWWEWMIKVWDHRCPKIPMSVCPKCNEQYPNIYAQTISTGTTTSVICKTCFEAAYAKCPCGRSVEKATAIIGKYCEACMAKWGYAKCKACSKTVNTRGAENIDGAYFHKVCKPGVSLAKG